MYSLISLTVLCQPTNPCFVLTLRPGECKPVMQEYLQCLKKVRGTNDPECRLLAKAYLQCRMDRFVTVLCYIQAYIYKIPLYIDVGSCSIAPHIIEVAEMQLHCIFTRTYRLLL